MSPGEILERKEDHSREKKQMGSDRRVAGAYLDARFYWFPSCSLWHRLKFLYLLKTGTILPFVQRSIHRAEPTDDDELWTCGFEGSKDSLQKLSKTNGYVAVTLCAYFRFGRLIIMRNISAR